jgi:hypothetical protein
VLLLELLLCAIANAPAATNTKRIPGNFFISLFSIRVQSASEYIASAAIRQ